MKPPNKQHYINLVIYTSYGTKK